MTTDIELLAYAPIEELRQTLQQIALRAARVIALQDCSVALYQPVQDELVTIASSNPQLDLPRTRFRVGEGIAGYVGKTLQPVVIPDASHDPRFLDLGSRPIVSVLCVPIKADHKLMGIITAVSPEVDAFSERDMGMLETIAAMASVSISQLVQAHRLRVLNEIGQQLLDCKSLDESFLLLRGGLLTLIPMDLLQLRLIGAEHTCPLEWHTENVGSLGLLPDLKVMGTELPSLISAEELAERADIDPAAMPCRSYMILPLQATGDSLGFLFAGSRRVSAYGPEHLKVMETL